MSQPSDFIVPPSSSAVLPSVMYPKLQAMLTALLDSNTGSSIPSYAVEGAVWRNSTTGQLLMYDGTSSLPVAVQVAAPSSATDAGTMGDVSWDADYFYICTATDTWKRVAAATW